MSTGPMNSAELADYLINRSKNLKTFYIERDLPESFRFRGRVPFDMTVENNIAKFQVYALHEYEANQMVDRFLDEGTDE
jgi:hypothetical protein